MCSNIDMKFNDGNKSVEFKLTGFSEENSITIIKEIMSCVTNSGNAPQERRFILHTERKGSKIINKTKDIPELEIESSKVLETEIEQTDNISQENSPEETEPTNLYNFDNEFYQAYYICKCGDRGKHRIKRSQIYVNCRDCGKRMRVRDAHMEGFPMKDDYGNTFIAGEFKRSDEVKYGVYI